MCDSCAVLGVSEGNIPVIMAGGRSLAEAWENSLIALYEKGGRVRTEYDKPEDPPSFDATMIMVVEDPASEPLIHRAFPGGLEDLEEYRQEVIDGIKDHWVRNPNNPDDNRWEYTYHERLFKYSVPGEEEPIDQMARAMDKLAQTPHSRRAQAITWKPWEDPGCYDPPCLQSMWFRVVPVEDTWFLNMNVRFRSRDAYDAAFMNCFAFISLQEKLAGDLAEKSGHEVKLGRYVDESDSYHIYGRRIENFENAFLKQVKSRTFEERTWTREFAQSFFEDAKPMIAAKVERVDKERAK